MSIVGLPLLLLTACLTTAVVAGTVLGWRRSGRWRLLVRPVGILLSQALILVTVGLAVNRSEEFYPSWAALAGRQDPETLSLPVADGALDTTLRADVRAGAGIAAAWRPTGWTAWQLSGAATVAVSSDYLSRSTVAFPVVVSIMTAPAGRQPDVVPQTGAPVLLVVPASARTSPADLAVAVPGRLGRDLRVTPHGWALVAEWHQAALAASAIRLAPGRFSAVVLVAGAHVGTAPAGGRLPANFHLPVDVAVAVVHPARPARPPTDGAPAVAPTILTAAAGREWATGVRWAERQTPPVLAPPVVLTPLSGQPVPPR